MSRIDTDITKLYGVGKARAAAYERLGVATVRDLLEHYPRGYENRGDVRPLIEADGENKYSHLLTVGTVPKSVRVKGRMTLLKFRAYDDSGVCDITFFNQDYLKNTFSMGDTFRFYGKAEVVKGRISMTSPAFEPYSEDAALPPLVSVYSLTEGLSQKQIAKDVKAALVLASYSESGADVDFLPAEIRARNKLATRSFALRNIHIPESFTSLAAARKRLIFDELFLFSLGMRLASGKSAPTYAPPCPDTDITPLLRALPYELTEAQKRTVDEIAADMAKDEAMNRMVIGDVGCGKTVCAAAAMYIAVKNGRQAALMAPTEILARQHYKDITALFEPLGVKIELLVGSLGAAEKKRVHKALSSPDATERADVVIGTQALLSDGVEFFSPGLVVADEQHRFGVGQRALFAEKNRFSHMLVMSATPIPRSLALALYGNISLSLIDKMPPGRQRVDTFAVDESYRERLLRFIAKNVDEGGQVYIVCPSVDETYDDEIDLDPSDIDGDGNIKKRPVLRSAVKYSEELAETLPQYRVAFVHGRMKAKEKDEVMRAFAEGEIKILVSTTVIEVGVNVPNATLMIVENAERFGLSQLHQLRGRVGRGSRKSYCILVSESVGSESTAGERLKVMKTLYDGFAVAERDLAMRGPGDFLKGSSADGVRQSGGVRFKLAELCDDSELFALAGREAELLLEADPLLDGHPELTREIDGMFSLTAGTVN